MKKTSLYILPLLLCFVVGVQAQYNTSALWVNEFHYDAPAQYSKSDANEFVEIVIHNDIINNPEELAKYQLVLYSAGASIVDENSHNAHKGLPYDKSSLLYSAEETYHSLADEDPNGVTGFQRCNADGSSGTNYTILAKYLPTLQDMPAAFALIYNDFIVVQLISYEKRFSIKDSPEAGAAAGMMTELIEGTNATESSCTACPLGTVAIMENHSIQLTGNGTSYADFSWDGSVASTASFCSENGVGLSTQTIGELPSTNFDALAVQFIDFIGEPQEDNIALSWRTSQETNNKGFYLERRRSDEADFTVINFIAGKGTTNETQVYNYLDTQVKTGQVYYYRLNQIDDNDRKTTSNTIAIKLIGSDIFMNATPNPAKDVVNVRLENIQENATLQVTTMDGKVIKTVNLAAAKAQNYNLNIADLSTGFYLLRVENGQEVLTQKLSVL